MGAVERTLKAVDKLLTRRTWILFHLAEDKQGKEVNPRRPEAMKFCLLGACKKIDGPAEKVAVALLRRECRDILGHYDSQPTNNDIFTVNDGAGLGFPYIKKALRRAIKRAHAERL